MSKIIMLKGLPASGKSTWAKEQVDKGNGEVIRINKDDLRAMIHNGKHSKGRENLILDIRNGLICTAIDNGVKTIIIDDTNFHPKHKEKLLEIAHDLDLEFETNDDFLKVPLEECIRRDAKRDNPVGKDVILNMYNQYLKPKGIEYKVDMPDAIICDLDGTLALYDKTKKSHYDRDFENDEINQHVLDLITSASFGVSRDILFTSGRMEKYREQTLQFLERCGFEEGDGDWGLIMRRDGDNRPDYIVKEEMYENLIKPYYNIVFVVDDRPQVVRMWRSKGLFVFDVNQEGVEF